jgi:hypothetical protein
MSATLEAIHKLVGEGKTRVSQHGIQELTDDAINLRAVIDGVATAVVVEDYPT